MPIRRKDPNNRNVMGFTVASLAIANGDVVKLTSGTLTNNVSAGDQVLGLCVKTTTTADTVCLVDVLSPGDWCVADVGSGTPAAGDQKSCDMLNASSKVKSLAVGTDSSHDCLYVYNGSTTTVDCIFYKLKAVTAA